MRVLWKAQGATHRVLNSRHIEPGDWEKSKTDTELGSRANHRAVLNVNLAHRVSPLADRQKAPAKHWLSVVRCHRAASKGTDSEEKGRSMQNQQGRRGRPGVLRWTGPGLP